MKNFINRLKRNFWTDMSLLTAGLLAGIIIKTIILI